MVWVTDGWVNRCGREQALPADRCAPAEGLEVGDGERRMEPS